MERRYEAGFEGVCSNRSDLDRRKISVLSAGGGFAGRGDSGAVKRKEAG